MCTAYCELYDTDDFPYSFTQAFYTAFLRRGDGAAGRIIESCGAQFVHLLDKRQ